MFNTNLQYMQTNKQQIIIIYNIWKNKTNSLLQRNIWLTSFSIDAFTILTNGFTLLTNAFTLLTTFSTFLH